MGPKISTYYPFDYNEMIKKAKYAFIYKRSGNHGSAHRPYIVMSEDKENNKCIGFSIAVYNNGIEQNSEFSMPKDWVDTESLTTDPNKLICDWLSSQGEKSLLIN